MAPSLRAFECNVRGKEWQHRVHAFTAGKAKSEYLRGLRESWPDVPFTAITCHCCGPATSSEAFQRVAQYRRLPFAHVGMIVEVEGHRGVIVGANDSCNFDVLFQEGPHVGQKLNCHPKWQMKYFGEDGAVLAEFMGAR